MDALSLSAEALREPWRLWTAHLAHFGWEHLLANAMALTVPFTLAPRRDRPGLALALLLLAPLLSLFLLPTLGDGEYRGASGLACALWALTGLRMTSRRSSTSLGLLMLSGLALKLLAEAAQGGGVLVHAAGWQTLPAAHLCGALLGLGAALPSWGRLRPA